MYKYYIPHKIKVGDITHLADNDSKFAIVKGIQDEDIVTLQAPNGIFTAQVTFVERASVEVEVINQDEIQDTSDTEITIIQSISSISKFSVFLEKITEIGATTVIPTISELTLIDEKKARKDFNLWNKIIRDATEQSRNPNPPSLKSICELKNISKHLQDDQIRLCFATENVSPLYISQVKNIKDQNIVMAFGPESGWSEKDIEILKQLKFTFVRLKGNILRTETSPIVATSIIKFIKEEL